MRIDDVVMGGEYAWSASTWYREQRVKVIEEIPKLQFYGHRGVKIKILEGKREGETLDIPCRQLRTPWKEYEKEHTRELETKRKHNAKSDKLFAQSIRIRKALDSLGLKEVTVHAGHAGPSICIMVYEPSLAKELVDILEDAL